MREVQEAPCPRQEGRVMRAPRLCLRFLPPGLRLRRRGSAAPRRPPALAIFDISFLVPDMKAANLASVSGAALVNIASSILCPPPEESKRAGAAAPARPPRRGSAAPAAGGRPSGAVRASAASEERGCSP